MHLPANSLRNKYAQQVLATEELKVKNGLPTPFMNKVFMENAHYENLREIMLKRCTTELKL